MTGDGPPVLRVDAARVPSDAGGLDLLARVHLAARRVGLRLSVAGASDELRELLAFAGLDGVIHLEAGRQAEEREQRGRVEEEGELGDPVL